LRQAGRALLVVKSEHAHTYSGSDCGSKLLNTLASLLIAVPTPRIVRRDVAHGRDDVAVDQHVADVSLQRSQKRSAAVCEGKCHAAGRRAWLDTDDAGVAAVARRENRGLCTAERYGLCYAGTKDSEPGLRLEMRNRGDCLCLVNG